MTSINKWLYTNYLSGILEAISNVKRCNKSGSKQAVMFCVLLFASLCFKVNPLELQYIIMTKTLSQELKIMYKFIHYFYYV